MAFGNYYNSPIMQPNNYGYNGYQQPPVMQQPISKMPPVDQFAQPQPMYKQTLGLQGKSVDSIEVVKAMDIPLDGSVSYFPITDGSSIVTKQLQPDGTSKTIVYKPVEEEMGEKQTPHYLTIEEFDKKIKEIDTSKDLKEEIKNLRKQIKDIASDLDDIKEGKD